MLNKNKKIIFITGGIVFSLILVIALMVWAAYMIAPGSYPYAEKHKINANEAQVIKVINDFKENNPKYLLPKGIKFKDHRGGFNNLFYVIYFYFPDENVVLYTYTRPETKKITNFCFVSVSSGQNIGTWQDINRDFDKEENNDLKNKFEERIVNKIREKL